jgi:hypothetical protein
VFFEAAAPANIFGDVEVTKAVIGALATVIVAALGLYGVIKSAQKPSRTKPPTGETGSALEGFSGTQNEFMALVIADNKDLRDQLGEVKASVDSIKDHQETFLGAVRRYLMKLATAWQGMEPMPWPDEEDFHILEDTLPQKRVNRKEN